MGQVLCISSRGLVPASHPAYVGAVRARAMREADLVIAVGRKLDYQVAYGSPAAFPNERSIRIGVSEKQSLSNC